MTIHAPLKIMISLSSLMLLMACQQSEPAFETPTTPKVINSLSGKQAYNLVCASCHEQGRDGAPRTGHKDDWIERSWLWEAVIFEHAKEGFLDMPAKGGNKSLEDATVERAAEYMLSVTFPQVPPSDQ